MTEQWRFDMWLVFRSRGILARKLRFGISMLSLEAFLHVNLEAQISWQAQYFVNLEVQISWQAHYFVHLEGQMSWQAEHFVNLEVAAVYAFRCVLSDACSDDCALRCVIFVEL